MRDAEDATTTYSDSGETDGAIDAWIQPSLAMSNCLSISGGKKARLSMWNCDCDIVRHFGRVDIRIVLCSVST